jgi:hypothetical protein
VTKKERKVKIEKRLRFKDREGRDEKEKGEA